MNAKVLPIIQRISSEYCTKDCVQLMFTYDKALCVIKKTNKDTKENELIFYDNSLDSKDKLEYTNKYISDDRRKQFPYSNIPFHTKRIQFKKYNVVNQILDYDNIYMIMHGNENRIITLFCKVIKDIDSAIVIQDTKLSSIFYMNIDELKALYFDKELESNIKKSINSEISKKERKHLKRLEKMLK